MNDSLIENGMVVSGNNYLAYEYEDAELYEDDDTFICEICGEPHRKEDQEEEISNGRACKYCIQGGHDLLRSVISGKTSIEKMKRSFEDYDALKLIMERLEEWIA